MGKREKAMFTNCGEKNTVNIVVCKCILAMLHTCMFSCFIFPIFSRHVERLWTTNEEEPLNEQHLFVQFCKWTKRDYKIIPFFCFRMKVYLCNVANYKLQWYEKTIEIINNNKYFTSAVCLIAGTQSHATQSSYNLFPYNWSNISATPIKMWKSV